MNSSKSDVPVGVGTVAGIVAAIPTLIGGLVALIDGVETVPQAIVAAVALLVGGVILAVVIHGRMSQAQTITAVTAPPTSAD